MSSSASEKKALIKYRMVRARLTLQDAQLLYKQGGGQVADYEDEVELTKEQALEILESAAQFINSIEEKLSNQP
jgi:uncharacterized protein (UPF0332 family)